MLRELVVSVVVNHVAHTYVNGCQRYLMLSIIISAIDEKRGRNHLQNHPNNAPQQPLCLEWYVIVGLLKPSRTTITNKTPAADTRNHP